MSLHLVVLSIYWSTLLVKQEISTPALVSHVDILFQGENGVDSDSDEEIDGGEEKTAVESISQ